VDEDENARRQPSREAGPDRPLHLHQSPRRHSMNTHFMQNGPASERRTTRLRHIATACAVPAAAGVLLATTGGPADATVGPYVREKIVWGDCTIILGTVPDAYYRAFAGTDVTCAHYRSSITVKVDLWRYDSGRWSMVSSSGWGTVRNAYGSSSVTAPYTVPGCRYWDITTTVNVDGYQTYHDYAQDTGRYNTWNPTVGNCVVG
jgi:hypothetical protein